MKKMFIAAAVLLHAALAQAQPQATEGTAEFQRTQQPAAIIELPYPVQVVEKAIDDYMLRKGSKGNDQKGYKVFRGYALRQNQGSNSDLYFKIDRKGRREKDVTIVSLVVGRNGEEIKTRTVSDNGSLDGAKELLDDMVTSIDAYNLEAQIQDQDEVIKKAQKKYDGLINDQKDYERKIKNLQDKLEQNKKDQEKQDGEVKRQKDLQEALKGKRKTA